MHTQWRVGRRLVLAVAVSILAAASLYAREVRQVQYVRPGDEQIDALVEVEEGQVFYVDERYGSDANDGTRENPWKTDAHAKARMGPDDVVVHGASYYVDARRGNDAGDGSETKPWKSIAHALKSIRGGDEVLVAPGLYVEREGLVIPAGPDAKRKTTLRLNGSNRFLNRVVVTGEDGYLSRMRGLLHLRDNTRVKGLWFGGRREKARQANVTFASSNPEILECVFFNVYQLLAGSSAKRALLKDNLFVHMGDVFHMHPIYFSGGLDALGSEKNCHDLWCVGNVFVNGEGVAIHAWHRPANMTVVGNFATGHVASVVLEGGGHIAHHNFFWREMGGLGMLHFHQKGDNPNDQLVDPRYAYNAWVADADQFYENILGDEYPIMYPEAVYGGATHLKETLRDNYILPRSRLKPGDYCRNQVRLKLVGLPYSWYQHSEAEVEEAVEFIDRYFDWIHVDPRGADNGIAGVLGTIKQTWRKLAMSYNTLHIRIRPKPEELRPRPLPSGPAVSDGEDGIRH